MSMSKREQLKILANLQTHLELTAQSIDDGQVIASAAYNFVDSLGALLQAFMRALVEAEDKA